MINRIISLCLEQRYLIWILALIIAIGGYLSYKKMAVEAYPELDDVTVQVTTQVPGLAAEEIEKQITIPLERALSNTPGLVSMRSSSTFALSLITMIFKDGTEDYFIRQRVLDRINTLTLPPNITPSLDPVSGSAGEIYRYTLESDSKNLMELSDIQHWIVIPALREVPGVADVNNFGGFTKQYELVLDPEQLQHFNISYNDVINAIGNNNANSGGGRITRGEQSYVLRGIGQIHTLDDLGDVVVNQTNSVPVLIKQLGKLQYGHQEREGILGKNNNPDTIEGIVLMLKYENPSAVLKGIHAKIDQLNKQLEPMGTKIVPYIDRDDLVELTVHKVFTTVFEGIGLVVIVLGLFLGSPLCALIVSISIPFALIAVFNFMVATKMPANLFSLGAIDFGIIVDSSIVVMDAILRRKEQNPDQYLQEEDVVKTTEPVARPIFFATLIIIVAYFPLFTFERAEGKLFRPMAFTVSVALIGALICSITLIPGLAYQALRKPRKLFHNRPLEWLTERYKYLLDRLLRNLWVSYLLGIGVLLSVVFLGITAGKEFLPLLDEGTLWLQVQMPSGLSLEKANEMSAELRKILLEYPEVSYVVTQLGRSDDGTDPWTPSHIEAAVGLKPYHDWPDQESKEEFVDRLNKRFESLPGYSIGISQPIIDGVNDMIGGAHSPLVLRVYGDDLTEARIIGAQIVDVLKTVRGTTNASIFQEPPIPQLVINIDREKAARFGINIADVQNLIQSGLGGAPVTTIYVADRMYNATVRFSQDNKKNIETLGNLFLNSSSGAKIALSQIASIEFKSGESNIAHQNSKRQITISIDNRDRDLGSYFDEAKKRIDNEVKFDHQKFHLEWAGQFENQRRSQAHLLFILGIVLLLMGILLFFQFGRIRLVALILAVVPMATLGGLISIHVMGETINMASAIGFIALFGVAVQNGIIMVSNIRRIEENENDIEQAVLEGASERLRPILMTATVASFGMLPAAMAIGVGTDVQRNIAVVIVGGLFVATLLTLFILPAYYFALENYYVDSKWSRLYDQWHNNDRSDDEPK
jgi:cobalt-zinc-cadmium resistance protein CzcA